MKDEYNSLGMYFILQNYIETELSDNQLAYYYTIKNHSIYNPAVQTRMNQLRNAADAAQADKQCIQKKLDTTRDIANEIYETVYNQPYIEIKKSNFLIRLKNLFHTK